MFEGILIDATFAQFFINKVIGNVNYINDYQSLDVQVYKSLSFIKTSTSISDLNLTFSINNTDLIKNGKFVNVTVDNRIQYIYLYSNFKLNNEIDHQTRCFIQGLNSVIPISLLKIFNPLEVSRILTGVLTIDVSDFKLNTEYSGVYDEMHPTIVMFWEIVEDLSIDDLKLLIRFITSVDRPPLLGFKELRPRICVRDNGNDQGRFPTASTCVNLFKVPIYQSVEVFREKLLAVVRAGAGFDFS